MNNVAQTDVSSALRSDLYDLIRSNDGRVLAFPKINGAHAFLDTMLPETGAYAIRGLRKGQPTLSRFVASKEELVDQGREMSCAGYDAYFATASFVSAEGK